MKTWLVLDVSCLCFRAFHTTGQLRHNDEGTGIIFGVLRDIVTFSEMFLAHGVLFAFDHRESDRRKIYPDYKKKRQPPSEEEAKQYDILYDQVYRLQNKILPDIGFVNIYQQAGKEADDIIASLCYDSIDKDDDIIIVSSDKDLWQILDDNVLVYNPIKKKSTTKKSFYKEWGLTPKQWIEVKAIAGCNSDNIKGIKGVGEKTAAAYLRGELKAESKASMTIGLQHTAIALQNRKLVRLPIKGTNYFQIDRDNVTHKKWNQAVDSLGIRSLHNQCPYTNQ